MADEKKSQQGPPQAPTTAVKDPGTKHDHTVHSNIQEPTLVDPHKSVRTNPEDPTTERNLRKLEPQPPHVDPQGTLAAMEDARAGRPVRPIPGRTELGAFPPMQTPPPASGTGGQKLATDVHSEPTPVGAQTGEKKTPQDKGGPQSSPGGVRASTTPQAGSQAQGAGQAGPTGFQQKQQQTTQQPQQNPQDQAEKH